MSFNVTQCPACESTFNTNSRVLAAAAGKVRCGACLNVFEAVDHFLIQNEDGAREDQDESVFVGNDPQEYFDPSRFLTRSALREPPVEQEAVDDPIADQFLHEELEGYKTIPDEFFSSVLEELRGRVAARNEASEQEQGREPEAESEPQLLLEHSPDEAVDDGLEEDILAAFSEEPLEATAEEFETVTDQEPGTLAPAVEDEFEAASAVALQEEPVEDAAQTPVAETDTPTSVGNEAEPPHEVHAITDALSSEEVEAEQVLVDSVTPAPQIESQPPPAPAPAPTPDAPVGLELSAKFTFGFEPEPEPSPAIVEQQLTSEEGESEQPEPTLVFTSPESEEDAEQFLSTVAEELEPDSGSLPLEEESTQDDAGAIAATAEEIESSATASDIDTGDATQETDFEIFDIGAEMDGASLAALSNDADVADETIAELGLDSEPAPTSEEEPPQQEALADAPDSPIEPAETEDSEHHEPAELDDSTEAIRARALEAELDDEDALEAIPSENLAALGSMSPPVEFLAGKDSRLLRSSLLLLSIVFLGALLSGQYLWQRMALYSQLPQLRGAYEFACARLGCVLPEYRAIDAIRSENLSVQSHPTFENGLMVNTVIRNSAAFEQPFPILILSFNSAQNSIVALREFSADEYLDPALRSTRMMPPMTPVQIGLAIMDPGPLAVNYTLAFRFP